MTDAGGHPEPVTPPRRAGRRVRWTLAAVAVVVLLAIGAAGVLAWQVEHPRYDAVSRADAVVVLGEPDAPALALAQRMLDQGISDQLLLLTPFGEPPQCGEPPAGVTVTCVVPDPLTTQGDARAIREVADEHGWDSLVVVTWDTHVTRSRVLIRACWSGTLMVTGYPLHRGGWNASELVHQVGGLVKAHLSSGC